MDWWNCVFFLVKWMRKLDGMLEMLLYWSFDLPSYDIHVVLLQHNGIWIWIWILTEYIGGFPLIWCRNISFHHVYRIVGVFEVQVPWFDPKGSTSTDLVKAVPEEQKKFLADMVWVHEEVRELLLYLHFVGLFQLPLFRADNDFMELWHLEVLTNFLCFFYLWDNVYIETEQGLQIVN